MEEASGPAVEIWPDNLQAVNLFIQLSTQWRVGMNGPTGLDYNAVEAVLRISRVKRSDWPDLLEELRSMEDAALDVMRTTK